MSGAVAIDSLAAMPRAQAATAAAIQVPPCGSPDIARTAAYIVARYNAPIITSVRWVTYEITSVCSGWTVHIRAAAKASRPEVSAVRPPNLAKVRRKMPKSRRPDTRCRNRFAA
jgi:hypothetical protein